MKKKKSGRFVNSALLFNFCQKILSYQRNKKVYDQDIGKILNFSPSDCSHWKKGNKNVFSLDCIIKLSDYLQVDSWIIYNMVLGISSLEESLYDYYETIHVKSILSKIYKNFSSDILSETRYRVSLFVKELQSNFEYASAPLYLPEILNIFPFITCQPVENINRLSRILKVNADNFRIHFKKVDLNPQTRASVVRDLARIIFRFKRSNYFSKPCNHPYLLEYEELIFSTSMLMPENLFKLEFEKVQCKRNLIDEISSVFWVPRSFVYFKIQDYLDVLGVPKVNIQRAKEYVGESATL